MNVLAIGAHPDDIEFMMAGTLLMLGQRGINLFMWNLADGSCGSKELGSKEASELRWKESRASAELAGAKLFRPVARDMEIIYDVGLLKKMASGVRRARPDIMLVPSYEEYMEDHSNAARLAVSAAFARGMPNFEVDPAEEPWEGEVAIYHAAPYSLHDPLGRFVEQEIYVNIEPVMEAKREMLEKHKSQARWLEESQGLSYVHQMESMCLALGERSGRFKYAEGWRRHFHLGFGREGANPLVEVLGEDCLVMGEEPES